MADRYLLPRRLDDPELIGFWTIDEFLGLIIPFAWGILAQHIFVGIALAFVAWFALRKAKSGGASAQLHPCCLLVSTRIVSGIESHAALPLPTSGRLKEE